MLYTNSLHPKFSKTPALISLPSHMYSSPHNLLLLPYISFRPLSTTVFSSRREHLRSLRSQNNIIFQLQRRLPIWILERSKLYYKIILHGKDGICGEVWVVGGEDLRGYWNVRIV